jgi:hypothetical protein
MTRCVHQDSEVHTVRPVVKAAVRRLWRDPTTVQIGLHPQRALVVGGLSGGTAHLLAALDGTQDDEALRATARGLGVADGVVDRLLTMLSDAAVLDDAATDAGALAALPRDERDRLGPDLASMSLVSGRPDAGLSTIARRQRATIRVAGAGRVGSAVATVLAASGIGHLVVDDPAVCRPADCGPAGLSLLDVGASRAQAAHAAVGRVSRSTRTTALETGQQPDAVVLAPSGALDPLVRDELMRSGVAHLLVTVRETAAVIGPFVFPGITSCGRCHDLHRSDRDPAWPMIAAQLAVAGLPAIVEACDVALATLAASVCALQVLTFIDGGDPATRDGTLEVVAPDWRIRRRSWFPHPACGCRWPHDGAAAEASAADG